MEGHYEYSDDFEEESDGSEAPKALDPLATPSSRGRVVRTKRMNTHKKRKLLLRVFFDLSPNP